MDFFVIYSIHIKAPPNHVLAGQTDPEHVEVDDANDNSKEINRQKLESQLVISHIVTKPGSKSVFGNIITSSCCTSFQIFGTSTTFVKRRLEEDPSEEAFENRN